MKGPDGDSNPDSHHTLVNVQSQSYLLNIPRELRDKIWALCVQHGEDIAPHQIAPRSNKFTYTEQKQDKDLYFHSWMSKKTKSAIDADPLLDVVALSLTCRQIYDEVSGTDLFYKLNEFKFANYLQTITYLFAITPKRMQAITSINIPCFNWYPQGGHSKFFRRYGHRVLAACTNLKTLKLTISHAATAGFPPRFKHVLNEVGSLRGLESLQITAVPETHWGAVAGLPSQLDRDRCAALQDELQGEVTKPRTDILSQQMMLDMQGVLQIDVLGTGRLGEDRKPGIVSSRTRSQVKEKTLTRLGTVAEKKVPKWDLEGILSWNVETILKSKRTKGGIDDELECIQLRVQWAGGNGKSWEKLGDFGSLHHLPPICDFYEKDLDAVGIDEALRFMKRVGTAPTREGLVVGN